MSRQAVVVGAMRTPIGSFQGSLASVSGVRLGAVAIKAALSRSRVQPQDVDEVIMGQVLTAGVGQAPARQASLHAGIPVSVPCTTINKVCGSGLKAVMLARQSIQLGEASIVVAGGMESMSMAPYILPNARQGMRMGHQMTLDAMIHDGLWDPYGNALMGTFGDRCANKFSFSREAQDVYAKQSYEKAIEAQKNGWFNDEIVPIEVEVKKQIAVVEKDEEPANYKPEKMASLKPAFDSNGSVTAANASKLSDGAAALVIMGDDIALSRGFNPLVTILSTATVAQEPSWFTTAPIAAITKVLRQANLSVKDVDLFEINEAFSVVAMAAIAELNIPRDKVNVYGGAVSLGHPIGCSGARMIVTLISAMINKDARVGCAAICLGGGEAVAMVVKR